MAPEWSIGSRNQDCFGCERAFALEENVFSLLSMRESNLHRSDLCSVCFDQRDTRYDLVYWRTSHQDKKHKMRLDFDFLLGLVEQLLSEDTGEKKDFCYLVSLLLVRHRKLNLVRVEQVGEVEFMCLRKTRSKKVFKIESRQISESRREALVSQLNALIEP